MDLFIDPTLVFEKNAAEVALPEDPNMWPGEILQELYKQVPYIADFEPHVTMDRVDAERGYGFGHIEVMNKTEIQRGTSPEGMEAAGVRQARIPVVVKDRKLQPFDILITADSQMLPLTEPRLRQAIFRPQAFDITARTPGDMSMIGQLYPPYRQNYGFGGGGATMSVGMGKSGSVNPQGEQVVEDPGQARASTGEAIHKGNPNPTHNDKTASVLTAILSTINESDYNSFFHELRDSKNLQAAFVKNAAATASALSMISNHVPASTQKTAGVAMDHWPIDVVQVRLEEDGYHVKSASSKFWQPREITFDRGELVHAYGEKIALDVDTSGSVTMASGKEESTSPAAAVGAAPVEPEADRYEMIKDFGVYKVKDETGRELVGLVFPNLVDVDGTSLPLFLFSNGSQAAVQGEVVGIRVGAGTSIPEGNPRGRGVFYEVLTNGKAQATIPMTIQATLSAGMSEEGNSEGTTLSAETFDGRPIEVKVQPNITKITPMDGALLVPETMAWLPLDGAEDVALMGEPEEAEANTKMAANHHLFAVEIRAGGVDSFSLSGMPVEKIAKVDRSFLSLDDSLFLLSGLGVDLHGAIDKLGEALVANHPVEVTARRQIALPEEQVAQSYKTASAALAKMPNLRVSLIKEAAVIPDPTAVDTVLSLGFINPENLSTFVSYLPTLDDSVKKMCELLLAARLGTRDIPTSALEKAILLTEQVIEGLKVMAFNKN